MRSAFQTGFCDLDRSRTMSTGASLGDISRRNPQEDFELLARIGSGTYGDVYKVRPRLRIRLTANSGETHNDGGAQRRQNHKNWAWWWIQLDKSKENALAIPFHWFCGASKRLTCSRTMNIKILWNTLVATSACKSYGSPWSIVVEALFRTFTISLAHWRRNKSLTSVGRPWEVSIKLIL